jgi:tRNA 2-selenouridine synthase
MDALVHPHQIEVQEFASYGLVIDARSTAEYVEDHIPGAINLPVLASEARQDASSSTLSARLPARLVAGLERLQADEAVLVYCARGGLDSLVWAEPLRAKGWCVDVLGGGWPNYRRWVLAALELLPRALSFRVLRAPPVSGMDRVLTALQAQGQQVIDLAALAGQQLGEKAVLCFGGGRSQSAFESRLVHALRFCDPAQEVWVSELPAGQSALSLPAPFAEQLRQARVVHLDVPKAERIRIWQEELSELGADVDDVIASMSSLDVSPSVTLLDQWRALTRQSGTSQVLGAMMDGFVDRADRSAGSASSALSALSASADADVLQLASLRPAELASALRDWTRQRGIKAVRRPGHGHDAQIRP